MQNKYKLLFVIEKMALTDWELAYICDDFIPTLDMKQLESFYRVGLVRDKLARATPDQRKKIFNEFKDFYVGRGGKEDSDILNEEEWLSPPPHGRFMSDQEQLFIEQKIDRIRESGELESYYRDIEKDVFPRTTIDERKELQAAFRVNMQELLDRERRIEMIREEETRGRELTKEYAKGDKIEMNDISGSIIDISGSRVKVRWKYGGRSWVDAGEIRKL